VGGAAAARAAVEHVHAAKHEFVLHFDVDVIASQEFRATDFPGEGGLSLSQVREALRVFAAQPNLAAIVVAGYNPDLDPDGDAARRLIDLLVEVLTSRLETGSSEVAAEAASAAAVSTATTTASSEAPRSEPESATDAAPDSQGPAEPGSIPS
jgi:hypothetical protein